MEVLAAEAAPGAGAMVVVPGAAMVVAPGADTVVVPGAAMVVAPGAATVAGFTTADVFSARVLASMATATRGGGIGTIRAMPTYPYYGDPYYGNPYYGNPYYGNPYYGNPYYGNPYYGSAYYGSAYYGNPNYENRDPRSSATKAVQAALARRGYYRGSIDGAFGPETRNAIRSFQAHQGLPVTGQMDGRLIRALQS